MQDYRVELDAFSGPMDLLLFLVKRDEVDLRDIPVARLTEQYLAYLKQLEAIDVNLAGEFLVMAATLLELKSQMLVPQAPAAEGESETSTTNLAELDPRRELVAALLAYKRFKDTAMMLERRAELWAQRYPRNPVRPKVTVPVLEDDPQQALWDAVEGEGTSGDGELDATHEVTTEREFEIDDANVLDLAETFARVMESIGRTPAQHQVLYDDTPIGLHADDILDRLQREQTLTLQNVFEGRSRGERIGLFLALLELVRQRKVLVQQEDLNRPIQLSLRPADAAVPVTDQPHAIGTSAADSTTTKSAGGDSTDGATGTSAPSAADYDWPDEDSKRIAQRRERLRFKWAEKKKTQGENANPDDALAQTPGNMDESEPDAADVDSVADDDVASDADIEADDPIATDDDATK